MLKRGQLPLSLYVISAVKVILTCVICLSLYLWCFMSAKEGTIAIIVVCHENVFIIYVYWAMLLFRYLVV